MFCKWCGLESETSDVCSWCGRPFSSPSAKPQDGNAGPASPSTTGEPTATPTSGVPTSSNDHGGLADELDDDLSPMPFLSGGLARPSAPAPAPETIAQAPPPAPAAPSVPPVAARESAPVADNPPIAPIPIKRPAAGAPPPIIPISRSGQGAQRGSMPPVPPPAQRSQPPTIPPLQRSASAPPSPVPPANKVPLKPLTPQPLSGEAGGASAAKPPAPKPAEPAPGAPKPPTTVTRLGGPLEPADTPAPTIGAPQKRNETPAVANGAAPAEANARTSGGKTYYCRWCGLQSEKPDVCTWCHRDLKNMPTAGPHNVTMTHTPKGVKSPSRPKAQGPVVAEAAKSTVSAKPNVPGKPVAAGVTHANGAAQVGGFQAQASKYYSGKVLDPVSGQHYDADTGKRDDNAVVVLEDAGLDDRKELARSVGAYLGVLLVLAGITAAAVHAMPGAYLAALAIANAVAGLAMPLMRVVPFGEDDSDDVAIALALILLLGPFAGGIAYLVIGVMKQDANPAIAGIFISNLAIRAVLDLVTGHSFQLWLPFQHTATENVWFGFGAHWTALAAIAGWYAAGIFHKPNE